VATMPAGGRVVLACCDPLLPQHAARFRELAQGGKLLIVIDTSVPSYMDAAARAALAASLDCVRTVVLGERTTAQQLDSNFVDLSAEEAEWRESFFGHVRQKGS
jgi:hypothetical protein